MPSFSKYRIDSNVTLKEISVFAPGHEQYDVVVYIVEDKFSPITLRKWCDQFNAEYEDYIFLDDHRDADTYIRTLRLVMVVIS